jgi:hypothetical protein
VDTRNDTGQQSGYREAPAADIAGRVPPILLSVNVAYLLQVSAFFYEIIVSKGIVSGSFMRKLLLSAAALVTLAATDYAPAAGTCGRASAAGVECMRSICGLVFHTVKYPTVDIPPLFH